MGNDPPPPPLFRGTMLQFFNVERSHKSVYQYVICQATYMYTKWGGKMAGPWIFANSSKRKIWTPLKSATFFRDRDQMWPPRSPCLRKIIEEKCSFRWLKSASFCIISEKSVTLFLDWKWPILFWKFSKKWSIFPTYFVPKAHHSPSPGEGDEAEDPGLAAVQHPGGRRGDGDGHSWTSSACRRCDGEKEEQGDYES